MSKSHLEGFRNPVISREILHQIKKRSKKAIRLMEVCGTHTSSIFKNGIQTVLPKTISLLSGPGCPVCVTSLKEIDAFLELSGRDDMITATFGDLLRVPGSNSSLQRERANGKDIRIVYSAMDALMMAKENSQKKIVFLGVGFETTAPTIAASILSAKKMSIDNYFVFSAHKLIPPALGSLMERKEVEIDGFILPGHVSVIIGTKAYRPFFSKYQVPCVIAGFEPADVLQAILELVNQIEAGLPRLANGYQRVVTLDGNKKAVQITQRVFKRVDVDWRGLGRIPKSGLAVRDEFHAFDAQKRFDLAVPDSKDPEGCACGEILLGTKIPSECPLYQRVCTPTAPVGPCMVSSEGTCAAYYKYSTM